MPVVKLYANLRKLAGVKEKVVPGNSIRAVLKILGEEFPGLQPFLQSGKEVQVRAIVTLNGHTLNRESLLDVAVSEEDEIAIFPPIAGG